MEGFEDDDDTHFCNKCHSTINGLENYVRHRQSGCSTGVPKTEEYHCTPPTPNVSYPEVLNADAFFSSLELQSSAKPQPRRATDLRPRRSGRHEERNRKRRKEKSPDDKDEGKEKLALLPVVTDLDDLGIPSLVGFPEIVATATTTTASTSKPTTSTVARLNKHINSDTSKIETSSYSSKQEGSPSQQKRDNDENQRIEQDNDHNSVWLEDKMLTDLGVNNENENKEIIRHSPLDRYVEEYDLQDEDSDDGMGLDIDTGAEDSYSDSDDDGQDGQEAHGGHNEQYPPQSHTGGKWKPGGIVQAQVHLQEDDGDMDEREYQLHPPPTYTGGKWKPSYSAVQKRDEYEKDSGQPPPGHTRGKWVPGARADDNTGYWCSLCNRKLTSQVLYNRHLTSNLHAKRTVQEIDGAIQMPRSALPLLHRQRLSKRQKAMISKKNSESAKPSTSASTSAMTSSSDIESKSQKKSLRRRLKMFLTCVMCHVRVRRELMGKHLLSHYHCRIAGITPSDAADQRFILDNMANIVRQCPFQCAPCRFYFNTGDTFLRHWRSDSHKEVVSKIEGSFVCAFCNFSCDDNESVEAHIMKQGHQDVVSALKGSVPIVIRRQRVLTCSTCCRRFRYNIELGAHARKSGHKIEYTASDEYQSRFTCSICGQVVRSQIALQRHHLAFHKPAKTSETKTTTTPTTTSDTAPEPEPYFCACCSKTFKTNIQAVAHRRTLEHKEMVKRKKASGNGDTHSMQRDCPHCDESQMSLSDHKRHLLEKHPNQCHKCARCGMLFALSQDVTWHTRGKQCSQQDSISSANPKSSKSKKPKQQKEPKQLKCKRCTFTSKSKAELIYHLTLHDGPAECKVTKSTNKPPRVKYKCPLCTKNVVKAVLIEHIRIHTGERPFQCGRCGAGFVRRSNLKVHKSVCKDLTNTSDSPTDAVYRRERKFICSECNSSFHTKHTLRQHILRHAGKQYKCGLPGCPTILRTENELNRHRKLVHDTENPKREFQCADCSYAAKTKSQLVKHLKVHQQLDGIYRCKFDLCDFQTKIASHLKRHMHLHTGKKPYKCRHCIYACNNLENLRKHILSTSLHPGKTIYECQSCDDNNRYQTNFAKELRAHLLQEHPNKYPTPVDAINYISKIFSDS